LVNAFPGFSQNSFEQQQVAAFPFSKEFFLQINVTKFVLQIFFAQK
jgi:hypothetical protein